VNYSSSILEVNLKNLIHNYKVFKKFIKNKQVAATIKANAYGIGDKIAFSTLYKNGCRHFFLATLNEGLELRKSFKKGYIYILNGLENNDINIFKINKLIPILNSKIEMKVIEKTKFKFGIHIDTGLNRLGINKKDLPKKIYNKKNLQIVLTHLASSDEKKNLYNYFQNKKFKSINNLFKNKKIIFSLANSMGTILGKDFHYDLLRPGISLYGGHYNTKLKKYIKPVVKLKAKILQIKRILKNEYIGYNQTYKTKKSIWIAVIGIGYGDGISRMLNNKGFVYYKNHKFRILGRISMDSITIDISKSCKLFKIGQYVEIINYSHGIDELAKQCETISNEILTSISNRVQRIYK
jgi:alanine racemase